MTPSISEEIRGDDAVTRVTTTVSARPQMFGRALQLTCLARHHAVSK
jgi:hypothetical protein